jgi:hypothetical protein
MRQTPTSPLQSPDLPTDAIPAGLGSSTRTSGASFLATSGWAWIVPRAIVFLVLAIGDVRTLADDEHWNIFGGITLGIHEMGHVIFGPFGEWIMVAGGSFTQVAGPVIAAILLARQRDRYGVAVVGTWLTYSLANLATYIGDATAQALPLVSLGDTAEHDWNYLLGTADLLRYDTRIATLVRDLAALVLLAATVLAIREMARRRRPIDLNEPSGG